MGFSEKISEAYTKIEDKYFDVLDALESRGLPVYKYSDFFEDKGIPSFIVTISIFIGILILLSLLFGPNVTATGEIIVNIKDVATGQGLQNVSLSIQRANGAFINENLVVGDGSVITIPPLQVGTRLNLIATKQGYQSTTQEIILGSSKKTSNLFLERSLTSIDARIRLVDEQTQTRVTNAIISARYNNQEYTFNLDSNGNFRNTSIPEGVNVLVRINSDGYLPVEETFVFFRETIRDISLRPDSSSFSGKSTFLVAVSDDQEKTIDNAQVTIYEKETGTILLDDFTTQGIISGPIQTGISLRIVIQKEGYITYDSEKEGESLTLRRAEETFRINLRQGGEKLNVMVVNELGLALSGSKVKIYDLSNVKLKEGTTTVSGFEFSGLDPESEVVITAHREGYLPNRTKVLVGQVESVPIILKEAIAMNSTRLDIFTIDEFGNSVAGAKIDIFILEDINSIPYGLSGIETNVGGFKDIVVEKQKVYEIVAQTRIMQGSAIVEVGEEIHDTKIYINMQKKPNIVEFVLRDVFGNFVNGNARISGVDGRILYNGEIKDGKIFFDAENRAVVDLEVNLLDGNIFKTKVQIGNKKEFDIIVYERQTSELAPEIEFIGIETEDGRSVKGITPGAFYYVNFKVNFPIASSSAGVHIRTGSNTNNFVDEDNTALFEIQGIDADVTYSYSYNPQPSPGDEVVDRANQGFAGEANKWGEAVIQNPSGTYTIKAKIRVSEFTSGKIPIHYRAWAKIEGDYYRMPFDEVLEFDLRNEERNGLYAKTDTLELTLYESLPECSDDLCVTINFVDEQENFYDILGFEALTNEVYGIQATFTSINGDFLQVNVESDYNIEFLGTQTGSFGFTNRSTQSQGNLGSTTLTIPPNGTQKVIFYFKTDSAGAKEIFFSALGENEIEKLIIFNAVVEKEIIIELSENNVMLGRNFTARVLDSDLVGIGNALIKIIDKEGSVVKSIMGNNTEGNGLNGNYRIENNLKTGLYIIEASVAKHKTKREPLLISTQRVLSLTEESNVKMLFEQKQKVITKELKNNSDASINDLSFEVSSSDNFRVTSIIPQTIGPTSNQQIQITIEYIGENEFANETIDFTIRGMIEGTFLASATGKININYNQRLDSSCLVINPSSLTMNLVGRAGASDSDIIEVTNNCGEIINLTSRTREITRKSFILVKADNITLQPGETQNISINANNLIERQFARNESFNYEVVWESGYLTKKMNVSVNIINPQLALSYPGQMTLFLAQDAPQRPAIAAQPIFVTNVSQFPIDGIKFSIDRGYGAGVSLSVEPNMPIDLARGQSITPTRILFAESSSKFSEPVYAKILIEGQLGNLNNRIGMRDNYNYDDFLTGRINISNYNPNDRGYSTGQEVLGVINVEIHFSGLDCLKASLVGDNTFNLSAQGAQRSTQISLQNTCAEPVRIIGAEAAYPQILVGVPNAIISPGENVHLPMSVLSMNPNLKLQRHPITIKGITEISQTPISSTQLNVNIFSGINFSDEFSKSTSGIQVNVCGETQKESINVPISATGTNCSEGYCDALQASEYLARQIDIILKRASSQGYSAQKNIEALACGTQGFCTFGQLGIQQEEISLYLKNDILSVGALREEFSKITSGTSTGFTGQPTEYLIRRGAVGDNIIQFIAATGFGRQIFIDERIEGCGYYIINVTGAFPYSPSGVEFQSPVLVIRVSQKVETKECSPSIENLINFTPVNEGYTIRNDRGTWATTVNAENNVTRIGEEIAKKIFGEDRFGTGNGNTISIKEGAVSGGLAEICISGGQKKDIIVTVNPSSNLGTEGQRAFEEQIIRMVTESLNGNFGNNCLVRDADKYSCVRLTDTGGAGGLRINLAQNSLIFSPGNNCIEATISSSMPESVYFDAIPQERFLGVRKLTIESIDNSQVFYSKEFIGGGQVIIDVDREVVLQRNDALAQTVYEKKINICATPAEFNTGSESEGAFISANLSQFLIRAINKSAGQAQGAESEIITISTGTLHPDDWLQIFFKERDMITKRGVEHPYYFTIMWEGEPISINLAEYDSGLRRMGLNPEFLNIEDSGVLENREFMSDQRSEAKKSAMNWYFTLCFSTAVACNTAYGGFVNGAIGAIIDCAIPAATMMKGEMIEAYEFAQRFFNSSTARTLSELPVIGAIFANTPAELSPQDFSPTMIGVQSGVGGALGGTQRLLAASMSSISKFNYTGTSRFIANELAGEMKKSTLENLTRLGVDNADALATEYSNTYRQTLQTNLEQGLRQKLSNQGLTSKVKNNLVYSRHLTQTQAQEVVTQAIQRSNPDLGNFLRQRNLIPDNLTPAMRQTLTGVTTNTSPASVEATIRQKLQSYVREVADPITDNKGRLVQERTIQQISQPNVAARNVASDIIDELAVGRNIPDTELLRMKQSLASNISRSATSNLDDVTLTMSNNFRRMASNTNYESLFRFSTSEMDNIAGQIRQLGQTPEPKKIQSRLRLTAPRLLFSVGAGVACAALANYVGLKAYTDSLNQSERDQRANASKGLDVTLFKGDTYKVILNRSTDGPLEASYTNISQNQELQNEMRQKLSMNEDGEIKGTFLIWEERLSPQPPEKRNLTQILMQTDIDLLRERMYETGINRDEVKKLITEIRRSTTQQLIHIYTHGNSQTNNRRINYDGFDVPEPWVGSLAIMMDDYDFVDKEKEIKGTETKLKNKVLELAKKVKEIGNNVLTEQVAHEIFSDREKADTFYRLNVAWTTFLTYDPN